jgi:hypothetical protein
MRLMAAGMSAALLVASADAAACGCGVPGLDAALTTPQETWGARLAQSARLASGRFNARGDYRRLGPSEHDRRYELTIVAAYRPLPKLELGAVFGYLRDSTREAGVSSSLAGAGDVTARARFEAVDETPSFAEGPPVPALALTAALRAPTAKTSDTASLGLGAWEPALGLALERSVTPKLRFGLSADAALRRSDEALGVRRRLGPRVSTQASAWYWPAPQLAASLSSSLLWEGDATLTGARRPGTGSRQWQLGVGAVYRPSGSHFRPGIAARYVVPIASLGVNALATTTLELSLAYTR